MDNDNEPQEAYDGWSLWERYFEYTYGPDWEHKRKGRSGECLFCAHAYGYTTEISDELTERTREMGGFTDGRPTCNHRSA